MAQAGFPAHEDPAELYVTHPRSDRNSQNDLQRSPIMFLTIGIVLLVVWLLGFMLMRKVLGGIIHVVLIIAVVAIAWHFVGPMLK